MSWSRQGGRSGPRGYHHGNLKEALIDAALELIAQKGPAGFTFAEAARWAGVSPAAPYRHFRDRDELMGDVARRGFDQFEAVLARAWDDGRPDAFTGGGHSTGWARPICNSPAASRPIIRRCSKPASHPKQVLNSGRRASGPSPCCAPQPSGWSRPCRHRIGDAGRPVLPISPDDVVAAPVLVYLLGLGLSVPPGGASSGRL